MDTFYVVQIMQNDAPVMAIDYPKDFPIPSVGDELIIKDEDGFTHHGVVIKKRFSIRDYRELHITINCK